MPSTSNTQRPAAPAPGAAAPSATPAPAKSTDPLFNPNLPTNLELLQNNTSILPAPSAAKLSNRHKPNPQTLPTIPPPAPPRDGTRSYPAPNRAIVQVVIPTANKGKVDLLVGHLRRTKPAGVTIAGHTEVPADSGVGEQPYDGAGPRGAFRRVVAAVRKLGGDGEYRARLAARGVGTLLVASVENFLAREEEIVGAAAGTGRVGGAVPVDYGVVVFCRVDLVGGETAPPPPWVWRVGVSRGVTAPAEYWRAAEAFGFEDQAREHGRVTVGELLAANIPGLDKADWHKVLAGVSRYELLGEAMRAMEAELPWPAAEGAARAGGAPVLSRKLSISVLPLVLGSHLMATAYAVAERATDLNVREWRD
ncbi:uncharacterized protein B0H64DRAFT_443530 [Chaetomium fimeti]|uniref:Non-canonical purine NTP phosphatase/PRRC1 domain-containing protein n=1 Tax=Chaetomium fimeti TaxID=1854472 RepID=A0AAE0LQT0_9PEZI|nr:hypothetical protein B0H64DRAFT_443530 [Chaetomium fimeti]